MCQHSLPQILTTNTSKFLDAESAGAVSRCSLFLYNMPRGGEGGRGEQGIWAEQQGVGGAISQCAGKQEIVWKLQPWIISHFRYGGGGGRDFWHAWRVRHCQASQISSFLSPPLPLSPSPPQSTNPVMLHPHPQVITPRDLKPRSRPLD